MTQKLKFVLGRIESNAGNRENAGFQHFLLSHNFFKRLLFQGHEMSELYAIRLISFALFDQSINLLVMSKKA